MNKTIPIILGLIVIGIFVFIIYDIILNEDPLSFAMLLLFAVIIIFGWLSSRILKKNSKSKAGRLFKKMKDFILEGLP